MGCWVYATVANRARISIYDGKTETFSSYHTGDSTWQWLTVTKTLASDATLLQVTLYVDTADTSAYFDGAIMMTSAVPASNTDTSYFDQTSISVTGLDGSNDDTYEIYSYIVNGYDGAANFDLQINGDTTAANYGYQWLRGVNATAASSRAADEAGFLIGLGADLGEISFNQSTLYAKTGYVRTNISKMTQGISGTTVTGVYLVGNSYNDTSTNITSLVIKSTGANGIGVGSRIIILRRNSLTSGSRTGVLDVQGQLKGCWQTVYKTTLAAAATSVSITGLDGDTAVMYRLRVRAVGGADGVGVWCLLNNDSGLTYGQQTLYNDDATTPAAIRHTPYASYDLFRKHIDTDELLLAESILYAKSGNLRVGITESSEGIATTTITTLGLVGHVWSNAADNITSIVVKSQTNGLGIGTVISVDAYRPQT